MKKLVIFLLVSLLWCGVAFAGPPGKNLSGTGSTDSGALGVGVYDEFDNSNATNLQDVLDDFDSAIGGGTTILKDVVATPPLLVDGVGNVDDVLPGTDANLTFSIPAATNSVPGHATAAHITAIEANTAKVTNTDDQTAAEVVNTPAGNIAATDVQAAVNELDTEKEPLLVNSAGLAAVISDETGTGVVVFSNSPSISFGADSIAHTAVYSGTTSLEETTAANDSGAVIIGVFDEFTNSDSTNVQDVLDDIDAAIAGGSTTLKDIVTTAPLTGGENDVLPGADADLTLAITVAKDIVATPPVTVNAGANLDDVIIGADANITIAVSDGSTTAKGVVELSTDVESVTGASDTVVVTPGTLTSRLAEPGAIGGTTPAAITGTTITANTGFVGDLTGTASTATIANTGDSATGFFSVGTHEHERGGMETDLSAYSGVLAISGGATIEVDTPEELETYAGLGAFFSDYADDADASTMRTTLGISLSTLADPTASKTFDDGNHIIAHDIDTSGAFRVGDVVSGNYMEWLNGYVRMVGTYYLEGSQDLSSIDADGEYGGDLDTFTVDSGVTASLFGQPMHIDTDNELVAADIDDTGNEEVHCILITAGIGANKTVLYNGKFCEEDLNFASAGLPVYSTTNPSSITNAYTTTAPSSGFGQRIGTSAFDSDDTSTASCIIVNLGSLMGGL